MGISSIGRLIGEKINLRGVATKTSFVSQKNKKRKTIKPYSAEISKLNVQ